jgi:competence protein ComEA
MYILKTMLMSALLLLTQLAFAAPVNVNTADAKELAAALNGVGEKKAQLIVDFRTKNGDFKSINDLLYVKGVGPKLIKKNKDDIRLSDEDK